MKIRPRRTAVYAIILVIILTLFAYFVLNYTRRVTGTSMLPTLEAGDLVVIENAPASSVQTGDVIVYSPPCASSDFSVIHRVIGFSGGGFITKGDNNPQSDQAAGIAVSPITPDCYSGRVVFVVPYIERIATLPYGANYLIAALIVMIVLVSEFYGRGTKEEGELTGESPTVTPPVV